MVSAYGNNSRKRTVLLTETFFNSRGCPLTRELTVLISKFYVTIYGKQGEHFENIPFINKFTLINRIKLLTNQESKADINWCTQGVVCKTGIPPTVTYIGVRKIQFFSTVPYYTTSGISFVPCDVRFRVSIHRTRKSCRFP